MAADTRDPTLVYQELIRIKQDYGVGIVEAANILEKQQLILSNGKPK